MDPEDIRDIHAQAARASQDILNAAPQSPIIERRSKSRGNRIPARRPKLREGQLIETAERKADRSRLYALSGLAGSIAVAAITTYAILKANSESLPEAAGMLVAGVTATLGVKYAPGGFRQKIWYVPLAAMIAGGVTYGTLESNSGTDITGSSDDDPAFVGGGLVCDKETDVTVIRTQWDTLEVYMGTTNGATLQSATAQLEENNPDFDPNMIPVGGQVPVFTDCVPALTPTTQP